MIGSINCLDAVIFCGYLLAVFVMGVWFARQQESNEEYFFGGRRMNWIAVGISLFATAFSSLSFVALPREAAFADYHFLLTLLMIPLLITPILWFVFVPVLRRLRVTSVYEYLEIRFHPLLRRFGTLLFAGYALGWMGSMLYATGLIVQAVLHLNDAQMIWILIGLGVLAIVYTVAGGIKAVVWTDVLQAATLGGGVFIILLIALSRLDGGLGTVWRIGQEHHKFRMFYLTYDFTQRQSVVTALAYALFMYLPGYTVSQVTVQRYLCVSSIRQARQSLLINAAVITLTSLLFLIVGSTIFAYYNQPGQSGLPVLNKQDQIFPFFVATELPPWGLTGLLLAGLFAAVMSTIDSGINSLAAVVAYDWLGGEKLSVTGSRLVTLVFGTIIVAAAVVVPAIAEHVIDIIAGIAGTFLGLLLGLFLLGMFFPRANTFGALVGFVAGVACLAWAMSTKGIPHWWYGAFASVPIVVVGYCASWLVRPPRPDQLRGVVTRRQEED